TLRSPDIGEPPEIEVGWNTGVHLFDERFDHETCLFDGGAVAHVGMRMDTNRVPSEIKRSLRAQQEKALLGEQAFLSRAQKRELRDLVGRAVRDELVSGRHRRSKMIPVLWDADRGCLLCASGASGALDALTSLWADTFDTGLLHAQSAGTIAAEILLRRKRDDRLETMAPTAFTKAPEGSGQDRPEPAWASREPLDFLGNEWLIWLWFVCEERGGHVVVQADTPVELSIAIDHTLETECAWGVTGKQSLRSGPEGISPIRMIEAKDALASGKWPRRASLIIADESLTWNFTMQADRWLVGACTLPRPEEPFEDPRAEAEDRIEQTRRLDRYLLALFEAFLDIRASERWPEERQAISRWIRDASPSRPEVHVVHRSERADHVG
ncbi:MAG: hypothetical protein KDA28_02295, partial [Phycisphaerales bacterium]|nr:hypothetical protein [Phycisphaerales bacterium]